MQHETVTLRQNTKLWTRLQVRGRKQTGYSLLHAVCDIKKKKLRGLSPQANYTDRVTAAVSEVVPTFAGRGCYVVSATDSHGVCEINTSEMPV
jgi:hypothetical protein